MAEPKAARDFPFAALPGPLDPEERSSIASSMQALLSWQRTLADWPARVDAPDATPIVSLYRRGTLAGCAGLGEGSARERLLRGFLAAMGDVRFGGVDQAGRDELVAQVSYVVAPRPLVLERAEAELELGSEGALLRRADGKLAMLLPDVARDHHLGTGQFLDALSLKAETPRDAWIPGNLWAFRTERVIARQRSAEHACADACAAARSWLASRVDRSGRVAFALDPREGGESAPGPLWHGRAALAVRALDSHPDGRPAAARARRWLARELGDALAGRAVAGFPESKAMIAGTVALAVLCGIELEADLRELARNPELAQNPWHAAQVVFALGPSAPPSLFPVCARELEQNSWAPWTALAAHRLGAFEVFRRAAAGLAAGVRSAGPHAGGVGPSELPEVARTAASVEALSLAEDDASKSAVQRARAFLRSQQLTSENYPLALEPSWCHGAFPISPVHDHLQTDVTAHALLALETR